MHNASAARRNKRDPTEGEIGHRQCMTQTNQQQTCLYSPIQQAPTTRPHDGHLASPITCVFQLATEFVDAVCTGRVAPGGVGSEVALTATEKLLSAMLPPRVFRVAGPGGTLRDQLTLIYLPPQTSQYVSMQMVYCIAQDLIPHFEFSL